MSKNKNYLKIRLKVGDTPGAVLAFLEKTKAQQICLVLERDFTVITEVSFIKRLQALLKISKTEIWFVTQKPYFQSILSQHKLRVQGYEPEIFAETPLSTLGALQGKVVAQKNKFTSKPIEFKPKLQTASAKPQFSTRKIENLKHERSHRGVLFFIFLFLIAGLSWLYFWVSPQAKIVIKPRINTTEVTQNIVVGLPTSGLDEGDNNLPKIKGIQVQTEITESQNFASTGRRYQITNAFGQVSLFNETNEPKYLLPSRLKTGDGVILRMQNEVTIPAKKAGEAGRVAVKVVADEYDEQEKPIGQRGNIEAGTMLFLPGLRTESRELYYAKANLGPLIGGSTLTTYYVNSADKDLAKPLLNDSLRIQAIESLKNELKRRSDRESKDYVLIEQATVLVSDLEAFNYDENQTGKEAEVFVVEGTLTLKGFVFDQDQVIRVMAQKLRDSQDDRKKMVNIDATSVEYRILETEDFETDGLIKLSVTLTGVETLDFEADNQFAQEWQQRIKKEILGRSVQSARGLLLNHPEIEEIVGLEIRPFWLQKIPVLMDQIDLEITY